MSRVWDVWPASLGRAAKRPTLADSAESAAAELGEEFVAEGLAAVEGEGAGFDLCVAGDDGALLRFRACAPPAFSLEAIDCCRGCGACDDDDPAPAWADADLCARCDDDADVRS